MKSKLRRRPRATAVANRRAILEAALEIFSAHGYAGSSTRAIAKKARLQQGHLAKYFPTKEALWRSAIEEFNREIDRILGTGLHDADYRKPVALARAVLPDLLRFFAQNHRLSRLMLQEFSTSSSRHDWVVSEVGHPIWQRLRPLFEALHVQDRLLGGSPIFSYFALIGSALLFFGSPAEVRMIAGADPADPASVEEYIEYLLNRVLRIRGKASQLRRKADRRSRD